MNVQFDDNAIPEYFRNVRSEVAPLLPTGATRVLEIGCGAGGTLAWLKERWPTAHTIGVDGFEEVRGILSLRADEVIIRNLDSPLPDLGMFDLILALDVLEHLRDPARVAAQLAGMLAPNGSLIISVPNIAHHSALLPLVFRRHFRYADQGILDRTHLRFFTEDSVLRLVRDAGLTATDGVMTGFGTKQLLFDRATLGAFGHYLAWQYIVRAERGDEQPFRWRKAG